jgi:hypothetical protein
LAKLVEVDGLRVAVVARLEALVRKPGSVKFVGEVDAVDLGGVLQRKVSFVS